MIKSKIRIISLLLVLTSLSFSNGKIENKKFEEKEPLKYSQRNDSYIDKNSINHIENENYQIDKGKSVKIILETKNNDVEMVEIIYTNKSQKMESIGTVNGKEIFQVEIPNSSTNYHFKIVDKNVQEFYGKNGIVSEDNIKDFKYRKTNKITFTPEWSKGAIAYEIYIDSFRNGNPDNDPIFNEFGIDDFREPTGKIRSGTEKRKLVSGNWGKDENKSEFSVNLWNDNYENKNKWENEDLDNIQNYTRYYGGDLEGINEKLDYLKELGVEYLIISSPFYSLSNHKYDAMYLNHVDPYFGYIEQTGTTKNLDVKAKVHNINGNSELNLLIYNPITGKNLLNEDPTDKNTWIWTESDLELANLVKNAHEKGLKIIVEVAPDITSNKFFALTNSKYNNWYLDKDNKVLDLDNEKVQEYISNSLEKWILGPDEKYLETDRNDGIDGIKYVYYNNRNIGGLLKITEKIKKLNPNIFIIGDFSLELGKDINSGVYDSGVDYNVVDLLTKYTLNTDENYKIDSVEFASKLNELYNKYPQDKFNSSEIYVDSLNTDRIYSGVINVNRVFDRDNQTNQGYLNIRPDLYDKNAINKLKRILAVQMMLPATPVIYYGDEKGMWGADSPRNRKPMLWDDYKPYEAESDNINKYTNVLRKLPDSVEINEVEKKIYYPVEENKEIEDYYKKLIEIRKNNKDLFKNSNFRILEVYGDKKTKERVDEDIENYLIEEKRKRKLYRNEENELKKPDVDFVSYEIYNGNESIIIVLNNTDESYPLNLKVPKSFGFYQNKLDEKEKNLISDKKIYVKMKPYEVKILYSNDKGIFDSFK